MKEDIKQKIEWCEKAMKQLLSEDGYSKFLCNIFNYVIFDKRSNINAAQNIYDVFPEFSKALSKEEPYDINWGHYNITDEKPVWNGTEITARVKFLNKLIKQLKRKLK